MRIVLEIEEATFKRLLEEAHANSRSIKAQIRTRIGFKVDGIQLKESEKREETT